MKPRYNKIIVNNKSGTKLFSIILCLCIALNVLTVFTGGITQTANATDWTNILNSTSESGWTKAVPCTDVLNDMLGGGSASIDIVGDTAHPSAYLHFGDDGDEIAVRIRLDGCDGTPESPEFKNFAYIGLDVNGDGVLDFFLGIYNPAKNNGRIGIYLADPGLSNTGPGNSGVTKPIASFQPKEGVNYSFISTGAGSSGFTANNDYFLTFVFTIEDVNNALKNEGRDDLQLKKENPFTYIIGTATQQNSLNGDINGIVGLSGDTWVFSTPISTNGEKHWLVTFDKTSGDLDASPKYVSVQNNHNLIDCLPPKDKEPKKRVDAQGFWEFVGWCNSDTVTEIGSTDPLPVGMLDPNMAITADKTVYAVWRNVPTQQLSYDDTVHFNPNGGTWGAGVSFQHVASQDGIIKNMPSVPSSPSGSPPVAGNYVFGGWTVDYKVRQTTDKGVAYPPNVIIITNGNPGPVNNEPIDFFVWSQEVAELSTPNELAAKGYSNVLSITPSNCANELTVYAMWLVVPSNAQQTPAKIHFYDNLYSGTATSPAYGTELYQIFFDNSNKIAYEPTEPRRQGYVFRGWDTSNLGTGTRYSDPKNTAVPSVTTYPSPTGSTLTQLNISYAINLNMILERLIDENKICCCVVRK